MAKAAVMLGGGGNYTRTLGLRVPVSRGLRGVWWHDGDSARGPVNLVTRVAAALIGAPVYRGLYASFGGGAGLVTDVYEEADGASTTFFVGASSATLASSATQPGWIGNLAANAGGVMVGESLFGFTGSVLLGRAFYDVSGTPTASSSSQSLPVSSYAAPRLYSCTVAPGVGRTIRDHTAGTEVSFADTRARVVNPISPFRIGSFSTFAGANDQWTTWRFGVVLTAQEIAATVAFIRAAMVGRASV